MFARISNYVFQSINELKKVSWPKRSDIIRLTVIVVVATVISMLMVAGLDWLLVKLVNYFVIK